MNDLSLALSRSQLRRGFRTGRDTNLARYVENSPTNYIDPTGHEPIDTGGPVPPTEEAEGDPPADAGDPTDLGNQPLFPPDFDFGESESSKNFCDSLTPGQKAELDRTIREAKHRDPNSSKDDAWRRFATRFLGALQAAGGVFQCLDGVFIVLKGVAAEEMTLGTSTVLVFYGGAVFAKGLDNASTGLTIVQNGEQQSMRFAESVEGLTGNKEFAETLNARSIRQGASTLA